MMGQKLLTYNVDISLSLQREKLICSNKLGKFCACMCFLSPPSLSLSLPLVMVAGLSLIFILFLMNLEINFVLLISNFITEKHD